VLTLVALLALPAAPAALAPGAPDVLAEPALFDAMEARGEHVAPAPRARSKKAEWLDEKARRPNVHLLDYELYRAPAHKVVVRRPAKAAAPVEKAPVPGERVTPIVTLFNVWTREALPVLPGDRLDARFRSFLSDHFTNQITHKDLRLVGVLKQAAHQFSAERIEVVSGYRSPKYNLMLRKKGHQVARQSQHVEGTAVDFRIRGVQLKNLMKFVKSLHLGGVGFYPRSQFVHADTGRIRFWTGS
jgi:hypothetical protein